MKKFLYPNQVEYSYTTVKTTASKKLGTGMNSKTTTHIDASSRSYGMMIRSNSATTAIYLKVKNMIQSF